MPANPSWEPINLDFLRPIIHLELSTEIELFFHRSPGKEAYFFLASRLDWSPRTATVALPDKTVSSSPNVRLGES